MWWSRYSSLLSSPPLLSVAAGIDLFPPGEFREPREQRVLRALRVLPPFCPPEMERGRERQRERERERDATSEMRAGGGLGVGGLVR